MQRMLPRVIPVLLLRKNGLYKTRKFKDPRYVGDPINAVRIFNEKEVDELIFLDIEASKEAASLNLSAIADMTRECFMPLCYGGGVSSLTDIEKILRLGVEKIAINTALFYQPEFVKEAVKEFGGTTIVASIDYKKSIWGKNIVFVKGGGRSTKRELGDYAKAVQDLGVGEVLLNSIDRDGTNSGYDIATLSKISQGLSIPLVACGGAGSIEDMKLAIDQGKASAAAAGALFVFVGKHRAVLINYPSQDEIRETIGGIQS